MIHPNAIREQTLYWTDEDTGLGCRAKPDFMVELMTVFDTSTSRSRPTLLPRTSVTTSAGTGKARCEGTCRPATTRLDSCQYKKPASIYVCVNPESPHQVCVNQISPTSMDMCRGGLPGFMRDLADCYRSGDWSETYEGQINTSVLDQWQVC